MSSSSQHRRFRRRDTGIHTVEGTVAGPRASKLSRQREEEQREFEQKRAKLQEASASGLESLEEKFKKSKDPVTISHRTMGLLTLEQFRQAKEAAALEEKDHDLDDDDDDDDAKKKDNDALKKKSTTRKKKNKLVPSALSFDVEETEGDDGLDDGGGVTKCPHVETAFLPDAKRDAEERAETERRKKEWLADQERIKKEPMDVGFAYWEAGHSKRATVTVTKGTFIETFLEKAKPLLPAETHNLRTDALIFVKEDIILPHHRSFYDLILDKATSSDGSTLLFPADQATSTKHAKIVTRGWYDANRHIFPASIWKNLGEN